jgi:nucleoid-associated protein YejK
MIIYKYQIKDEVDMKVKFKSKLIEIPETIPCTKDDGVMVFSPKQKAYVCFNVKDCNNKVSLKDYLKAEEKFNNIKIIKAERDLGL